MNPNRLLFLLSGTLALNFNACQIANLDCVSIECNPVATIILYSTPDDSRPPWIVFNTNVFTGNADVWKIRQDGSDLTQVTTATSIDRQADVSPDGGEVVFSSDRSGNDDIWIISTESGNLRQITTDAGSDLHPVWSPDGSRIAFQSDRSGNTDIWTVAADGSGGLVQITADGNGDQRPTYSATGEKIIWAAFRSGSYDLYEKNADGSGSESALVTGANTQQRPGVSPDNGQIVYNSDDTGAEQVWRRNADGSTEQITFSTTTCEFPSFAPAGGEMAYSCSGANLGLYLRTPEDREIRLLDFVTGFPRFE